MNAYILQEDLGFISLGWLCGGSRCFYTKKPVYKVEDLAGRSESWKMMCMLS